MAGSYEFGKWLQGQMSARNIGVRECARRAQISHTTVSKIKNLEAFATADMAVALGRIFDLSSEEALRLAGYDIYKQPHQSGREQLLALLDGLDDDAIERITDVVRVLREHELQR